MKSLMVIIDGLGDEGIPALGGLTPFARARHENMERIARAGVSGQFSTCENDFVPESLSCILRLLGVAKENFPKNRAYLELLAHHRDISEFEMVMRCNLVSIDKDGRLVSFNAQGLNILEMKEAAEFAGNWRQDIEFLHLSGYRNLVILDKKPELIHNCLIKPPHESVGENYFELLEDVSAKSLLLSSFLEKTAKKLEKYSHDGMQYRFYPWGISERTVLPQFKELHKLAGAAVCEAEIVKGIAIALGLELGVLTKATGDIDTNIREKAGLTKKLLDEKDFVLTHFNGADEASHRYDYQGKVEFIERIDKEFFSFILQNIHEPLRILVCGDHGTSSLTGKHMKEPVPFVAGIWQADSINGKKTIHNYHDALNYLFEGS